MDATGKRAVIALSILSGLTVVGCALQVLFEIIYGRPVAVDPTLQTLAETTIFALFGQGFFSQHVSVVTATAAPPTPAATWSASAGPAMSGIPTSSLARPSDSSGSVSAAPAATAAGAELNIGRPPSA